MLLESIKNNIFSNVFFFRMYIFVLAVSGKVIALIFTLTAYKLYQLPTQKRNTIEMNGNNFELNKEDIFKEIPLDTDNEERK